jgi:hypothetical protein
MWPDPSCVVNVPLVTCVINELEVTALDGSLVLMMSILGGGSYKLRSFFVVSAVSSVLLECDDWDAATAECSDDDDE